MDRVNELKDPKILAKIKGISEEELYAQFEKERESRTVSIKKEKGVFLNTLSKKGIKRWDYKHIRLDYKGRGITQEINLLDIDGQRIRGWGDNLSSKKEVPTLPEIFSSLGDDGWEMISHVINQDLTTNGTTLHYYNFKREKLD